MNSCEHANSTWAGGLRFEFFFDQKWGRSPLEAYKSSIRVRVVLSVIVKVWPMTTTTVFYHRDHLISDGCCCENCYHAWKHQPLKSRRGSMERRKRISMTQVG